MMQDIPIGQHFISSFGEDESGQLYIADYLFGEVYRVQDSGMTGPPVFNPPGTNSPLNTITIISSSPGAAIHYTTNGSTPTVADPVIASGGAVTITQGMTLSARAFRVDLQPSTITTVTYALQAGAPVFSPPHGPITNGTLLSINITTPGATIRYTLDGSDPTPSSPLYSGPFSINISNTVTAQAYRSGFSNSPITKVFFSGPLRLSPVQHQGDNLFFTFPSDDGVVYQIQFSSDLIYWRDTAYPYFGNGLLLYYYFLPSADKQFFRIKVL